MSGGQGATETQSTKVEQKSLKKTLDKYPYLWYNTGTRGEENQGRLWVSEFEQRSSRDQSQVLPNQAKRK
jgi:hypothetical protein